MVGPLGSVCSPAASRIRRMTAMIPGVAAYGATSLVLRSTQAGTTLSGDVDQNSPRDCIAGPAGSFCQIHHSGTRTASYEKRGGHPGAGDRAQPVFPMDL